MGNSNSSSQDSGAKKNLLAIDQGTTGTKTVVVSDQLEVLAESYHPFEQHFPQPGWVEHDLNQIWESVTKGIEGVGSKVDLRTIGAIGITNQRETICFWEKGSVKPIRKAIVWQDRRTADDCKKLKDQGKEEHYQKNTGLLLDPYFSGTKLAWAIRNDAGVKSALDAGNLQTGTIDSFLVAKLTNGASHVTEPSNASRTLCFHLENHKWENDLCDGIGVPTSVLPEVRPSVGNFGSTKNVAGLPDGIPITGILGDQQSALLGQACIEEGSAKCTYGTGAFLLMNTGKKPVHSKHRLLTTIAWQLTDGETTYALEGSAFIAGAAVQWLRDGLQLIKESPEIESLAQQVESSEGVVFVPALTGLGAPHWDPHARGNFSGLTRGTTRGHLARAALEGIAFQNADLLFAMQKDLGTDLKQLNVDGGACKNNLLMQFQSDILNTPLLRPVITETTSLGAVFAAGLGAGIWKDLAEVRSAWKEERRFDPSMDPDARETHLENWNRALKRTLS